MTDAAERARDALRQVHDPEAGLNIVDLGLVYGIEAGADGVIALRMTFTSESCPAGPMLAAAAEAALRRVPGVSDVRIDITFDPPWTPERITAEGRNQLAR